MNDSTPQKERFSARRWAGRQLSRIPLVKKTANAASDWVEGHPRALRSLDVASRGYALAISVTLAACATMYFAARERRLGELKEDYALGAECDAQLDRGIPCDLPHQIAHRRMMANQTLECGGWIHPCAPKLPHLLDLARKRGPHAALRLPPPPTAAAMAGPAVAAP